MAAAAALVLDGAGGSLLGAGPGSASASVEPIRLSVPGAVSSGVSLAALGSRVVATWAARSGATIDIYASASRDGGASFGAPVRVNDVAGDARVSGEQAPRVAFAGAERVIWISSQDGMSVVRSATRASGAEAFTPAASIHREGLTGARGWASLAASVDGASHVAWLDGRGDAPSDAPAPKAEPAGSAAHGGGHVHGAGRGGMRQDLFHVSLRADGTRVETRIAKGACFCCKTAVATAPDGSVYVAWRHIYPPNLRDIAVARSTDGGRTFEAPVRVSEDAWAIDGCPDDGPSIGVDARGVLHVAWPTRVSDQGKGIFYSRSTDGGRSFAPRVRVDATLGGAGHPQLAVAGERVVVVWDETSGGSRQACLREIAGGPAGSWPPRLAESMVLPTGASRYPAVAATEAATLVAWTDADGAVSLMRLRRLER